MGVIVLVLRDGSICHPLQPPPHPSTSGRRARESSALGPSKPKLEQRPRVDNATIRHITVKGSELDAGSSINLRAARVSFEFDPRAINYKVGRRVLIKRHIRQVT